MRLSENEIKSIVSLANRHFGNDVEVFLFGSRTDNQKHGGDIDLFIRNFDGKQPAIRTKINFIADFILHIGEQKIDVVIDHPAAKNSVFFKTIFQTGIRLC
jgi:predicted nucleotidyltransferase